MAKKIDLDGLEHFKQKENASIAGTESSSTASKAYKVGQHFYFKGTLVVCTVDIPSGGTITLNTNCKTVPLADEVSDLKTAVSTLHSSTPVLLDGYTLTSGYVNYSNGTTQSSSFSSYTSYIKIGAYEKIKFKRQGFTSNSVSSGTAFYDSNKTYISGVPTLAKQSATGYLPGYCTVDVPNGAEYVRFTTYTDTSTYGSFEAYGISAVAQNADNIAYVLNDLSEKVYYSGIANGYISGYNGTAGSSTTNTVTDYIEITGNEIGFTNCSTPSPSSTTPGTAFYDENKVFISGLYAEQGESGYKYVPFDPPQGAKYFRCTVRKDVSTYGRFYVNYKSQGIVNRFNEKALNIPIGLHTMPENQGVLNAIKRARQMTDVVWTPAFDLDRALIYTGDSYKMDGESATTPYRGEFSEGTQYKGLPYNEPQNDYRALGIEIPIDAFVSSVQNSRSVEALESTYSTFGASYYCCTCTVLTSYALDIQYVYSNNYADIRGMIGTGITISKGMDNSFAENIKLCDILQINGHCALITDIIRGFDGSIQFFEISEETRQGNTDTDTNNGLYGSVCRRYKMSIDEFTTYFDGFTVLRYTHLDRVKYYPSRLSPVGDEVIRYAPAFYPVLPYMGNLSSHASGNVKLLINNEGYDNLVVKKDGEAFTTEVVTGLDEITISCTDAGDYTAYLVSYNSDDEITKCTISCEWYIRPDTPPTSSVANNTCTFVYTTNGEYLPHSVKFGTEKFVRVYPEDCEITDNGDGTFDYTFSRPFPSGTSTSCRFVANSPKFGADIYDFTIST